MDADILVYDNAVEITGKLHFKDDLKGMTGAFGPMASFAILIEKPKKNRMWKYYIYAKAFGDSLVEKIKRIQKGTFVRIIGELVTYKMSMYINVKIITPISQSELEEIYDMHRDPEPEDITGDRDGNGHPAGNKHRRTEKHGRNIGNSYWNRKKKKQKSNTKSHRRERGDRAGERKRKKGCYKSLFDGMYSLPLRNSYPARDKTSISHRRSLIAFTSCKSALRMGV